MKRSLPPIPLLIAGFIMFGIAVISQLTSGAGDFSELPLYGKICCYGILLILGYFVVSRFVAMVCKKK